MTRVADTQEQQAGRANEMRALKPTTLPAARGAERSDMRRNASSVAKRFALSALNFLSKSLNDLDGTSSPSEVDGTSEAKDKPKPSDSTPALGGAGKEAETEAAAATGVSALVQPSAAAAAAKRQKEVEKQKEDERFDLDQNEVEVKGKGKETKGAVAEEAKKKSEDAAVVQKVGLVRVCHNVCECVTTCESVSQGVRVCHKV